MKKLMLGIAALSAGICLADVQSANIVGYMGKDLVNGSKMVAPMFLNVGENAKISINDIKVTGYEEDGTTSGDVYIKILDRLGAIDKDENGVKKWCFYYDDEDSEEFGAGWYQDDDVSEESKMGDDFTFDAGDGLWINGTSDLKVQIAGQVGKSEVTVPLRNGSTATGNPFAVWRSINDFSVTGYLKEDGTSGDVYIKILDRLGAIDKDEDGVKKWYFYYDDEDTEELGAGWYQDDDVSEEMKMGDSFGFDPGFGLWVNGTTDFSLVIKAPTIQ